MEKDLSAQRLRQEMVLLGKALVGRLFILFKTSQNYSEGHGALESPLVDAMKLVREILSRNQEAVLRVKGQYLYLAEVRLKPDSAGLQSFRYLIDELTRRGVGGICFGHTASAADLRRLVYAFQEVESQPGTDPYSTLLERMQMRMIAGIEVESLPEETARVPAKPIRFSTGLKARLLYRRSAAAMDREMEDAAAGNPLRLRELKRVVQQMIDLMARDEAGLVGLCTASRPGRRSHAVNVCILSLALGRRLKLPKHTLCELGVSALFHDIGMAAVAPQDGAGDAAPPPLEQQELEAHPLAGVKMVLQLRGLDSLSSRIVTGIFEHHQTAESSGFPGVPYQRLGLFGRVIGIADRYDTLTWPSSGAAPYSPERAIHYLLGQAGKAYDSALLKLFAGCVGLHAVGSLLLLDSGELAVVVANNPDPDHWCHPRVKIMADAGGKELDGELVDLASRECQRSIAGTLDPHRFGLDTSRYLLAG